MKCLVRQPAGLGDILFCLKIGFELCSKFDEVIWPVIPQYHWLPDYLELPPNLFMITTNDDFEMKRPFQTDEHRHTWIRPDFLYLPLELASRNYPNGNILDSKYQLANMNSSYWQNSVNIKRNPEKEKALNEKLGNVLGTNYNLICNMFASPPLMQTINIPEIKNDNKNVYFFYDTEFTPFDWMGIIEGASELHFVETGFSLIMEKCNLSTDKLFLYSRTPHGKSYGKTYHILTDRWNLM